MKYHLLACLLGLAGWASSADAQVALGPPVAPTCPPPAGPDCKTKFCHTGFGQMTNSLLAPIRLITGNLLPDCCRDSLHTEEAMRRLAEGRCSLAEMSALKIKLDESHAASRRAAVRYLATVDGHYYPEAEVGLITALRADRCECVRLEAAVALGQYGCVTGRIIEALRIAATCSEVDGNPAETSPRVRGAAQAALDRCLARGIIEHTPPPQMLPPPTMQPTSYAYAAGNPNVLPTAYYPGFNYYLQDHRRLENQARTPPERNRSDSSAAPAGPSLPTGQRTLYHLFLKANTPPRSGSGR